MNDLLKTLAPFLGTAIAGPFGAMAASFLADKLGVQEKTIAAVQDVLANATMTPEQISSIRQAEIEFKKWMADCEIKKEQLSVDNTKSARDMQIATKSWVPATISIIVVFGYFAILVGLMFGVLHVTDNQSLLILIGALSTAFGGVLNFWLGSSHGSQNKDAMLANAQPIK
jgi:hypothetical protein